MLAAGLTPRSTAIIDATKKNHIKVVEALIKSGVDIDVTDDHGMTSIMTAALYKYNDIAKLLLRAGASFDQNMIHLAIGSKDVEFVDILLQAGANPNDRDVFDKTPLLTAVNEGYNDIVSVLLDNGANPNLDPCIHAAINKGNNEALEMLLMYEADTEVLDNKQMTPLFKAVKNNDYASVQTLLKYKANVSRHAPIAQAVINENPLMVKLLLRYGANPNVKISGIDGNIVCYAAYLNTERSIMIVEYLLQYGVNANSKNKRGISLLELVVSHGHSHIVDILLTQKIDQDSIDKAFIKTDNIDILNALAKYINGM